MFVLRFDRALDLPDSNNQAQSAKPSACHKTQVNRYYACTDMPAYNYV